MAIMTGFTPYGQYPRIPLNRNYWLMRRIERDAKVQRQLYTSHLRDFFKKKAERQAKLNALWINLGFSKM